MLRKILIVFALATAIAGIAIAIAKIYDNLKWQSRTFVKFESNEKLEDFIKASDMIDPHAYNVLNTPLVLQIENIEVLEALDADVYGYKTLEGDAVQIIKADMRATSDKTSWAK